MVSEEKSLEILFSNSGESYYAASWVYSLIIFYHGNAISGRLISTEAQKQ